MHVPPIGWVLGLKFSKQGSFFGIFSLNMGGSGQNSQRSLKRVVSYENPP